MSKENVSVEEKRLVEEGVSVKEEVHVEEEGHVKEEVHVEKFQLLINTKIPTNKEV